LRWLTRIRVRLYDDDAARPPAVRGLRDGEVPDRAIADADVLSETLIRAVQRIAVILITAAGACALPGSGSLRWPVSWRAERPQRPASADPLVIATHDKHAALLPAEFGVRLSLDRRPSGLQVPSGWPNRNPRPAALTSLSDLCHQLP
jgi:hypothetical protein